MESLPQHPAPTEAPLLLLLTTGRWDCLPDFPLERLLPDYRLLRKLRSQTDTVPRLCALARDAAANGGAQRCRDLYSIALSFDDGCPEALSALLWDAYTRTDAMTALHYAGRLAQATPGAPEAQATLGWMQWNAGDRRQALSTLRETVGTHPGHAVSHWYLGHMLDQTGEGRAAEDHLRQALTLAPDLHEAKIALAWTLAHSGRLDEALELSHQAAQQDPAPHRLSQLGKLLTEKGEIPAALVVLQQALNRQPDDTTTRQRLAMAMARDGRYADAMTCIESGLEQFPDDRTLHLCRATLLRDSGDSTQAGLAVHALRHRWPDWAEGWFLLGTLHRDKGEAEQALHCFAAAQQADPMLTPAIIARAQVLLQLHQPTDAAWLMECVLDQKPDHLPARRQLVCALLGKREPVQARRHLHVLIKRQGASADLLTLLSIAQHQMGRLAAARRTLRRARRHTPTHADALRHGAAMALEAGDTAEAEELCRAVLRIAPDNADILALAGFILQTAGFPDDAEQCAERAVALAPHNAEAWRSLGHLHHARNRPAEAEEALHQAHRLAPERSEIVAQLAWVLVADDRVHEALIATRKACELAPEIAERWQERAEILGFAGSLDEAVTAARQAVALRPASPDAKALLARLLFLQGCAGDAPDAVWQDATRSLHDILLRAPAHHAAALVAIRLQAAGYAPAENLLQLLPRDRLRQLYLEVLEWLAGFGNAAETQRIAAAALRAFPHEPDIEIACLYLDGMTGARPAASMARGLRQWGLSHGVAHGTPETGPPMPMPTPGQRLRVAYLASHFHHSLLLGVLGAHDPNAIALHLYTDAPQPLPRELRDRVTVHRLSGTDLAASCQAHGIDIVIDTVGLHPFHGQAPVLRALRRRIAPLQCGWLGTWANSGGLFDLIIADDMSVPDHALSLYQEDVLRLNGGQWSWTPPLTAPEIGPPPAQSGDGVTFGSSVRGFRLTQACLESWAAVLAACPGSRLKLLGRQARDWEFQARFAALLDAHGVAPQRVDYIFQRPYSDHHAILQTIDIMLDSSPANGGLCLLDALWMGVPVVTLAGPDHAAQRQGASLLHSAGCSEWIADSTDSYVAIARDLASDPDRLSRIRHSLRARLQTSPLLDPRRVARQLEQAWMRMRSGSAEIAAAPDTKARCRALGRREIAAWLGRDATLTLPSPPPHSAGEVPDSPPDVSVPDVSVIVVLYNQAGLTLRTLTALADQQGVSFETIIVDNASQDETGLLLDRIRGATILRNTENRGFLLAANQGAAVARGRHILFLNNDAYLHRDSLAAAVRRIDSDASTGVVGGRIILMDGSLQEAGCVTFSDGSTTGYGRGDTPAAPEFRFVRDADYVSGAFLLIRTPLWRALGGFDTALAPAYYEDTDLCFRVRKAGFRVVYDPAVVLTHVEGASSVTSDAVAAMIRRNQGPFLNSHRDELQRRATPQNYRPLRDRWAAAPALKVLVLDNGVPHQSGGAGQPRARLMMHALHGMHVTFFPLWTVEQDWDKVYETLPDHMEVMLGDHAATLETFLERRRGLYDVLLVSRPPNMAFIRDIRQRRPSLFAGMRIVYDAEALFALREIAEAAVKGTPLPRAEAKRRLRAELDLVADTDCVLAVSAGEARLFRTGGARTVQILSHGLPCRTESPPWEARQGFLFIGALQPDTPNEDSLLWLAGDILPRLNQRLGRALPVTIVGACKSRRIAALANDQITLAGRIDDLGPCYDSARVFLAPTRFAAGVPIKVIEAACQGVPVVATPLLLRQLGWQSGKQCLGAKQADDFAAAMADLHENAALWSAIQTAARHQAASQFSPERAAETLRRALLAGIRE